MDIAVRRVPLKTDGSYEADPAAMAAAVDAGTAPTAAFEATFGASA